MGFASSLSCHTDALGAAVETCSRLVFGYTGGSASCNGATVVDDVATLEMSYTPSGGIASTTNMIVQLHPCEEVTMQDAIDMGWLFIALAVALGALSLMRRAAR